MCIRDRDTADTFLAVEFAAKLPATGHARFFLQEGRGGERPSGAAESAAHQPVVVDGHEITNGLVRVRLAGNGTFDLIDARTGRVYAGLNLLEDTGDVGDEYDYSLAPGSAPVVASGCEGGVRVVRSSHLSAVLAAEFELRLPFEALPDRTGRGVESTSCAVEVRLELRAGSPVVRVETRFDNRVRDHRLRTRFPTGLDVDHFWSDGHFMVNRRPVDPPGGDGWVQPPPGTSPQQGFSLAQDADGGLAVLNRGLPEIEAHRGADGGVELALTLLRCVGWLSRDDFDSRRRSNAGPTLYTPEAQCAGSHAFRYAVLPFAGDFLDADVMRESRRYRVGVPTVQGVLGGGVPGGTALIRQETGRATVTAIKRHRARDTLVVRMFNPCGTSISETLTSDLSIEGAWRTDLLEERETPEPVTDGSLTVSLGPHEIVTLELEVSVSDR